MKQSRLPQFSLVAVRELGKTQAFEDGLTLQGENELTTPLPKELSATDNLSKPAAVLSMRNEINVPCAQCLCAIRILPPTLCNTLFYK